MTQDLHMKKRWGQNFLQDKNILNKIIEAAELTADDIVLEIGTGGGFLTEQLANSKAQIYTVEIDQEKFDFSKSNLDHLTNIEFILGDFLIKAKEIFAQIGNKKVKVIANIPYYITTSIIEKLLFYKDHLDFIEIMIQKEVAERLTAKPGTKEYGSLTLFVSYHATVKSLFNVSRNCFYPRPSVDSKVIMIIPREKQIEVESEDLLFRLIKAAFWGRRKTLYNCFKNAVYTKFSEKTMEKLLAKFPYIKNQRGEKLSIEDYIKISNFICYLSFRLSETHGEISLP